MSTPSDPSAQDILAAVQTQLNQFGESVSAAHQQLRDELAAERAERARLEAQLAAVANQPQAANAGLSEQHVEQLVGMVEERLGQVSQENQRRQSEMDGRLDRVVQDMTASATGAAEHAVSPIVKTLEQKHEQTTDDMKQLAERLKAFDEQAALMVQYFGDITTKLNDRVDEIAADAASDVDARMVAIEGRVDEFAGSLAQRDSEAKSMVAKRVDDAEDRLNERLMAMEVRTTEEVGNRLAEIDAHVGRMGVGLDESVATLSDRIGKVDDKFGGFEGSISDLHDAVKAVDADAIDELKEKVSSAAGEAMLVRIEVERFQEKTTELNDKHAVRLTDLETQLQDQAMDTETAVQLERLEEVERALIALDPDKFVRVDDLAAGVHPQSNPGAPMAPATVPPSLPAESTTFAPPAS